MQTESFVRILFISYSSILPCFHSNYGNLSEFENYETALEIFEAMFVKKKNIILARHLLATSHQSLEFCRAASDSKNIKSQVRIYSLYCEPSTRYFH